MMSRSGGLKPKAVAGKPSVTRLTQSNWTGIKASGKPSAAVKKILKKNNISVKNYDKNHLSFYLTTSPMFDEIRYLINCFILL